MVERRRAGAPWIPPEGEWLTSWHWDPSSRTWLRFYTHFRERRVRSLDINTDGQLVCIGDRPAVRP